MFSKELYLRGVKGYHCVIKCYANTCTFPVDGLKYWKANGRNNGWDDYYFSSIQPLDIETASYGLLYLIETNQLAKGLPVAKWLLTKRNSNGGFSSTQVFHWTSYTIFV